MKETGFLVSKNLLDDFNKKEINDLNFEFDFLTKKLESNSIDIENLIKKVSNLFIALPSWAVGTGGTRFGRFPIDGEARNIFEKLVDCKTINDLTGIKNRVSLHIPWDKVDDHMELIEFANSIDIKFDAVNSNTFQDQNNQKYSYQYGSLSHTDSNVRAQAIAHNIDCIKFGEKIGSKALSVWIGDGGNFPGQMHFRKSFERYIDSLKEIYKYIPSDWKIFVEHKLFEPAFYSTVMNDWGSSYITATILGEKAFSLVDLGHHAPNTNIEMIVARLIQFGKLAGFHFNDSKYGDDDLDTGSINPYQLFLVFNELIDAEISRVSNFSPSYMIDQSHNITDPIESLISSMEEIQKAYIKAWLVDREQLEYYQDQNDPLMALRTLKEAYDADVTPILKMARFRNNGAVNPIIAYRQSDYRKNKTKERFVATKNTTGGIV